jgi:hypothetical protein
MAIIRRDKQASTQDLIKAVAILNELLKDQGEEEAVECLEEASALLKNSDPSSDAFKKAVSMIVDAFEGEHELSAYTHQRADGVKEWTEAEELSIASSRVLNLVKRISSR